MSATRLYTRRRLGDVSAINRLLRVLSGKKARRLTSTDIDRMIADPDHCWVVYRSETGQIVAMASLFVHEQPSKQAIGRIEDVVVDPGYEGRGIGRRMALVLHAQARSRRCHAIDLTSSREGGVRFWKRLGYEVRDTTTMRKQL